MLRILLAVSAVALATTAPIIPANAQMAAPAPAPQAAPAPRPATAQGWTLEKDTGTCVLRKGDDNGAQLAIASRGRLMISDPNLPDAAFVEGQQAEVTLRWSDGRVEATEAATIVLPGGGAQRLKPRKAYIIPYDTMAMATNASGGLGRTDGFVLGVERAGTPVWWMDTTGSGDAMKEFLKCADSVMIKTVQQPVVTEPVKKKRR